MRLAQLARKLSIKSSAIVEFLAQNQIAIQEASNTRVEDDFVKLVVKHFAPSLLEEVSSQPDEEEIEKKETPSVAVPVEVSYVEDQTELVEEAENPEPVEVVEVIKAPKIELSGLKVLGKIELPEAKKKEATTPSTDVTPEENILMVPKSKFKERRPVEQREYKNPISAARDREAKETERKRKEQLRIEKELKTLRYLNKVKKSQPTKAARFVKEQVDEMSMELERPKPKTVIGKFLRWLKT